MHCSLKADFQHFNFLFFILLEYKDPLKKSLHLKRGRGTNNWIWIYESYLIDVKIILSSSLQVNAFIMYTAKHFQQIYRTYYIKNHERTNRRHDFCS